MSSESGVEGVVKPANKSVLAVLTGGDPKDRKAMLSSLRKIEGVVGAYPFGNGVELTVVRRINLGMKSLRFKVEYSVTIRPVTADDVKELVKTNVEGWLKKSAEDDINDDINKEVKRAFAHLGLEGLDGLLQCVLVEILPSMLVWPPSLWSPWKVMRYEFNEVVNLDKYVHEYAKEGGFVIFYAPLRRKPENSILGLVPVVILDKNVTVEGLSGILDWVIRRHIAWLIDVCHPQLESSEFKLDRHYYYIKPLF
jgi:hypothetical protein